MIRFGELTEDEVFVTARGGAAGRGRSRTPGIEPLVTLRYFGPDANPDAPKVGDHKKRSNQAVEPGADAPEIVHD